MIERHLGERIHDLLDHRLAPAEAAAAMSHLAGCEACARRWQELRAAREALHSSEAGIDVRFAQQLLDRERMARMAAQEHPRRARAARGRDRRPVALTLSVTLVLGAVVGAAYVAGQPADVDPALTASSDNGALSVVRLDPATMRAGENLEDWIHPDWQSSGFEPVEAAVRETPDGHRALAYTLLTDAEPVLVLEQHGRLAPERVAQLPRVDLAGIEAYVVSTSPSRLVWQCGSLVVALSCDCDLATLQEVAAQFPRDDAPGAVDHVMAGLGVFADALTGH